MLCTVGCMVSLLACVLIITSYRIDVPECLRELFKWSNVSQNTVYVTLGGGNGWNPQA